MSYIKSSVTIPLHCWWECKVVKPFWKTVLWFLMKLNVLLLYECMIYTQLLSIYPNELKTYLYAKTGMWIFIAAFS